MEERKGWRKDGRKASERGSKRYAHTPFLTFPLVGLPLSCDLCFSLLLVFASFASPRFWPPVSLPLLSRAMLTREWCYPYDLLHVLRGVGVLSTCSPLTWQGMLARFFLVLGKYCEWPVIYMWQRNKKSPTGRQDFKDKKLNKGEKKRNPTKT